VNAQKNSAQTEEEVMNYKKIQSLRNLLWKSVSRRRNAFTAWACAFTLLLSGVAQPAFASPAASFGASAAHFFFALPQPFPSPSGLSEEDKMQIENLVLKLKEFVEGAATHAHPTPGVGPLTELLLNLHTLACAGIAIKLDEAEKQLSNLKFDNETDAALNTAKIQRIREVKARLIEICQEHYTSEPKPGPVVDPPVPPPPPPPAPHVTTPEEKRAKEVDDYCALRCKAAHDAWKDREWEREALDKQLIPLIAQAASQGKKYEIDPSDLAMYRQAVERENAAKAAYDACMRKCYEQAVGAKMIPSVPTEFTNPAPNPEPVKEMAPAPPTKTPTLGQGVFKSIQLGASDGTGSSQVAFAPPVAGQGSTILATVTDPNEEGPHGVVMATVDQDGKRNFFKGVTDNAGKLALVLPLGVTAFELLKVDQNGTPTTLAHTDVGPATHVTGTTPVPPAQIPSQGPAVTEVTSTVEMTKTNPGTVVLHTQNTNPLTTQLQIDDKPMSLMAASDQSAVGLPPAGTTPGPHQITATSDGVKSNSVTTDATIVTANPIPLMHTGSTAQVMLHVEGIPEDHSPTVHFAVSGAAKLASGALTADVPVKDGMATVKIQGVHPGQVVVSYQVHATSQTAPALPLGQNVRPGDYVMMDSIVHENLGTEWQATGKALKDGARVYQSPTGDKRVASFEKGQIVIQ
jgi:hypothetical protein